MATLTSNWLIKEYFPKNNSMCLVKGAEHEALKDEE